MALSFLSAKALRIEVTEGVDLESGVFLTGDRVTIGTGANDSLRLGSGDVVAEHLTLIRQPGAKTWEYFTSDRGRTQVDRGNPRTGTVRAGMWFRLGNDTRLDILRVDAPENLTPAEGGDDGKKEVPLTVALPVMALMVVAFALYMVSLNSDNSSTGASLRTAAWFVEDAPLESSLDVCLETGIGQVTQLADTRVERSAPDALFREYVLVHETDPSLAQAIHAELTTMIRKSIAMTHLLTRETRYLDASAELRRLENVLPVGNGNCPILSAARADLAVLEQMGRRR